MSIVILKQMYFLIILSFNSDSQQFHQYQENEQSHCSCYFCFNFFLFKIIVNMSVSSRCYYYNWVDTCPGGAIRGGFRGGVRGVRPPKIRKAYDMQRLLSSSTNNFFMNGQ
jgi:hypothetical protein